MAIWCWQLKGPPSAEKRGPLRVFFWWKRNYSCLPTLRTIEVAAVCFDADMLLAPFFRKGWMVRRWQVGSSRARGPQGSATRTSNLEFCSLQPPVLREELKHMAGCALAPESNHTLWVRAFWMGKSLEFLWSTISQNTPIWPFFMMNIWKWWWTVRMLDCPIFRPTRVSPSPAMRPSYKSTWRKLHSPRTGW